MAQFGGRGRVQFRPASSRYWRERFFLPLVAQFGVDIRGARGGLGRAALLGQAQGFGAEGRVIAPAFRGLGAVFHDEGNVPPFSVQI